MESFLEEKMFISTAAFRNDKPGGLKVSLDEIVSLFRN